MKNYNILKTYCEKIFLIGSGNFWFEEDTIGDDKSLFYRAYNTLLFFMYGFMTILEIMAALIGDFPEDEKSDSVTFAVSHTIVMIKILSVVLNKSLIKSLNQKMVRACERYETPTLMAEKFRIMKINIVAYCVIVYGSCFFYVFEGIRKLFDASHFVTIVTYYPSYEDDSLLANIFRVFTTGLLFIMMMTMILTVDSYTMVYLIMYKYKFITLRIFFEDLREEFDRLTKLGKKIEAAEKLTQGLIEGIVMHNEVLKLSKEIDRAFGTVIAVQLCQSFGSAVSLLLQLALSDQLSFSAQMKIIFFVIALFFLLGLFLCNAGEITYQASLLSDSIFYCGWYNCPPHLGRQNIRKLVLLAITQAQKPLVMKAFKMLGLTYATFLQVVRATYSVFALIHAQNE